MAFIISILLQMLLAMLCGRSLRRLGCQKRRLLTVGALPVPAIVLAFSRYLFLSAPLPTDTTVASRQTQLREEVELALVAAAAVLYVLGVAALWVAGGFAPSAKPDHLGDIFE